MSDKCFEKFYKWFGFHIHYVFINYVYLHYYPEMPQYTETEKNINMGWKEKKEEKMLDDRGTFTVQYLKEKRSVVSVLSIQSLSMGKEIKESVSMYL